MWRRKSDRTGGGEQQGKSNIAERHLTEIPRRVEEKFFCFGEHLQHPTLWKGTHQEHHSNDTKVPWNVFRPKKTC